MGLLYVGTERRTLLIERKQKKICVDGQRRARNAGRKNKDMYKDGCYRGMLCWIGKPV